MNLQAITESRIFRPTLATEAAKNQLDPAVYEQTFRVSTLGAVSKHFGIYKERNRWLEEQTVKNLDPIVRLVAPENYFLLPVSRH